MNEPLLVNSIGHSVGVLLFAGFLVMVLRDRRPSRLAVVAAALALLWNAGSLAVLAASAGLIPGADVAAAFSFSVLSLLPAVLLHLSLGGRSRPIWIAGYTLSSAAVILHVAELAGVGGRAHVVALWMITIGFGLLTIVARIGIVSMCLFLLAISFLHFGSDHPTSAWSGELALHHGGIPLALYVLLQDYRFLLLDAFLRFVVNSVAAAGYVALALWLNLRFELVARSAGNPFLEGLALVAVCASLVALMFLREWLQLLLTRVVFRRPSREPVIAAIRQAGAKAHSEAALLEESAVLIARFIGADRLALASAPEPWSEAVVPMRFLKGDEVYLLLGRRRGGRLYLSEDQAELARLAAVAVEQVERLRATEVERLVSQAELRALQSQINPHFLFNALNTLYGTIPREAGDARRMTLNLAEVFRYFLQSERTFIPLAEEMRIVRAYLEIEALRLGDRLHVEIAIDPAVEQAMIPVLSIQPLVENAVKHGIAARAAGGTVKLAARKTADGVWVEVSDNGDGFTDGPRTGVGLENVHQRLRLCFGDEAGLTIESSGQGSKVGFLAPAV